jgi:hypothetical protein
MYVELTDAAIEDTRVRAIEFGINTVLSIILLKWLFPIFKILSYSLEDP